MANIGDEEGVCRNDVFMEKSILRLFGLQFSSCCIDFLECLEKSFPVLKTVAVRTKNMKTWQDCRDKCNDFVMCHYFKWRVKVF